MKRVFIGVLFVLSLIGVIWPSCILITEDELRWSSCILVHKSYIPHYCNISGDISDFGINIQCPNASNYEYIFIVKNTETNIVTQLHKIKPSYCKCNIGTISIYSEVREKKYGKYYALIQSNLRLYNETSIGQQFSCYTNGNQVFEDYKYLPVGVYIVSIIVSSIILICITFVLYRINRQLKTPEPILLQE